MAALLLPCTDGNPTKSFAWSTNGPWTSRASKLETEAGRARARSSRPFLLQLCPTRTSGIEPSPAQPRTRARPVIQVAAPRGWNPHPGLWSGALHRATTPSNPVGEGHVASVTRLPTCQVGRRLGISDLANRARRYYSYSMQSFTGVWSQVHGSREPASEARRSRRHGTCKLSRALATSPARGGLAETAHARRAATAFRHSSARASLCAWPTARRRRLACRADFSSRGILVNSSEQKQR